MSKTPTLYKNNFIKQPIVANTTFYNSDYNTFISGRVLEKDSRLVNEAIVTLFEAHSMTPVVAMQTYNQGFFRFLGLNPDLEYLIVVKDRSGKSDYNALIYDRVKPKTYSFIDETYLDFSIKPIREVIEYPGVISNEEVPSTYLLNTFSFRPNGAYDSANEGNWSTTDVLFQQLTTGVNGTFNGSTSQVTTTSDIPSLKFETDFTLSFFLKPLVVPQGTSLGYPLISSNSSSLTNNDFYVLLTKDMKIALYQNSTALITSTSVLATDVWAEVAIVREDDSRLSLFINGIKEAHADFSGLISFNNNGTGIGSNAISTHTTLNGVLQQIRTYSKAIYSRDYGISSTLNTLQNFNPNLKVAIYFDSDNIQDIASGLPLEVSDIELSSIAYYEGSSSGYFNGETSYLSILPNPIIDLSLQDEYTFEFAFQPEEVISASSGTFHVASLGEEVHLEVRDNKLCLIVGDIEYICNYTLITHTTFNHIRLSRKQNVVGVFINDVLQLKFPSTNPQANGITFGVRGASYYKGWLDSIRFYYNNVYYDFNTNFRAYDPFKNNILNKFEFTNTYAPVDYTWMSFTTNGTLKAATDKCVEPPQSLYKLNTAGLTSTSLLANGTKSWTMEGWFCMGPVRSGTYYTLFDSSHSSQSLATYGNFVAVEAATSQLVLYRGSTIHGSQVKLYLSPTVLKVGEWFHFAWEYEEVDSKLRCYLNFELIYELETKVTLGLGNATRIGYTDNSGTDFGFSGWIDSVYLYRGVAKYSTPIDRLWHPWHNSKNLIDLIYMAEYLNPDNRDSEEPVYISEWKESYRNNLAKQTVVEARPLFVKGNTPFQDSILFDGIDDYLVLRNTLNILYDKSGLWGYLVVNFQGISTEVAEKRTLISATQNGSTESHTLIEVFLGDGLNVENNRTLYYRTQGYSKAVSSSYYLSQVISTTKFEENSWYTIRFMGSFANRTMKLYVNGSLDASLSNAFRNANSTYSWNTTNYYFGKTARTDDPTALPFRGYVNSLYIGSSSSTPSEEDFYRYDAYFRERLGIVLDTTHAYYNKPIIIGEYEN